MSNSLDMELTGKTVVLLPRVYRGNEHERTFVCRAGFGCHSFTQGSAIMGVFISDRREARIGGGEIEKLADKQVDPKQFESKPKPEFKTRQLDLE